MVISLSDKENEEDPNMQNSDNEGNFDETTTQSEKLTNNSMNGRAAIRRHSNNQLW